MKVCLAGQGAFGIKHLEAGFVKLEDTVVVTETGWEAYGDWGRAWNQV